MEAGFDIDEVLEREAYAEHVEHKSRRCCIFARNGAGLRRGPARTETTNFEQIHRKAADSPQTDPGGCR